MHVLGCCALGGRAAAPEQCSIGSLGANMVVVAKRQLWVRRRPKMQHASQIFLGCSPLLYLCLKSLAPSLPAAPLLLAAAGARYAVCVRRARTRVSGARSNERIGCA